VVAKTIASGFTSQDNLTTYSIDSSLTHQLSCSPFFRRHNPFDDDHLNGLILRVDAIREDILWASSAVTMRLISTCIGMTILLRLSTPVI
jgi:hypothetical protein